MKYKTFYIVFKGLSFDEKLNISQKIVDTSFKKFDIVAFLEPKCRPMLGQKWQKRLFS